MDVGELAKRALFPGGGVDLGYFGKRALLSGAGLSKNWNGFLADEFWGRLLGRPAVNAHRRLRDLLARKPSFEEALDEIETGDFNDAEEEALWTAVLEVFDIQDKSILGALHSSRSGEGAFLRFLGRFKPDRSDTSSGYLFTLNQDVLLEAMGTYRAGDPQPRTPAIFPSEGAFSFNFRSPLLLPADMVRRPVPDSAPQGGWPSLKGGLHYIKLHGSATWKTAAGRRDFVVGGGKTGLIDRSPLLSWYRDIFRAVCLDGGVKLIVIGYGFRDDHINDILIEGVTSHRLTLYVVGHGSHKDFHGRFDRRLLEGLRGYVNTPLAEILGDGSGDTPAMTEIRQFLDG